MTPVLIYFGHQDAKHESYRILQTQLQTFVFGVLWFFLFTLMPSNSQQHEC